MTGKRTFITLIVLILTCINLAKSQSNNTFASYTGGFTINLPQSANGMNGMGSGIRFVWQQLKAEYEIGYHERQGLPLAVKGSEFSIDEVVRRYFNEFSGEKQIYKKEISLEGKPGYEYKYETAKSIFLLRLFLIGDKLYQLQAKISLNNQAQEENILQVFNSFHLLSEEAIKAETAKKIDEATPKALPQLPIAPKINSDLQDRNLRGKIKSILTESANFAINDSLKQKKATRFEEFDEKSNLLKTMEYGSYGDVAKIRVYGYIAGKRVARTGSISREYDVPGILLNLPISSKGDSGFDESYTYKYLNGNLVEETTFWGTRILFSRTKYVYLKNRKETFYYDGGTKPFRKLVSTLDEKGNEIKISIFEPNGEKFNELEPYVIKYNSFDEQGNWTQRTISRFYGFGGNGKYFAESVEYRTIIYY